MPSSTNCCFATQMKSTLHQQTAKVPKTKPKQEWRYCHTNRVIVVVQKRSRVPVMSNEARLICDSVLAYSSQLPHRHCRCCNVYLASSTASQRTYSLTVCHWLKASGERQYKTMSIRPSGYHCLIIDSVVNT